MVAVRVKCSYGIESRVGKIRLVGGHDSSQGLLPDGVEGREAGSADGRDSRRWHLLEVGVG
jgi:hypothetical protein